MQRDVSSVVWNWRNPVTEVIAAARHRNELRRASALQVGVMAVIGALLYFWLQHHLMAQIVWGLAGLFLLLGLGFPPAYRPIHRFGRWLALVVGSALIYVLLVPFFYLFVFPVSVLLRLQRRDPLHRAYRAADLTYWIPRLKASGPDTYERQFLREDKLAKGQHRPVGSLPDRQQRGAS
ncbi:MAG: hypothetical protein ABIF77_19680 [bacterium]